MKLVIQIIGTILITAFFVSCNSGTTLENTIENLTQVQIDSLKRIECDSLLSKMRQTKTDTFAIIKTKPKDFEEGLVILDSMMNPKMKEWIKCLPDREFSGYVHHGFGTFLRNSWGLWGNSELAKNLYIMGILHPDDMSGIILNSYQRKLKGEDIKLEEQLKYYQDYWKKSGTPVDSILKEIQKEKLKTVANT